ncbi:MAG: MATE family efflux transporter [Lachnospiraceae bacterium]|nr:MATE family efflux transporter [Lachnospiraceae bacterium]
MNDNALDRKWNAVSLLRFALPTIAMMVFVGFYTITDTIFVARFVNTDALSAINMACPVIQITVGLGTMIATGGNAMVSRKMGAGKNQEAREDFTLLFITAAAVGFLIFITGILWLDGIVYALGASDRLFLYARSYLGILFLFAPANVIQTVFSNLFVTAGKPGMGLGLSVLAGLVNIVLDYFFIAVCGLGMRGAALGTGFGYAIPTAVGIAFFMRNEGALFFTRPKWSRSALREVCLNGSSEMVGQLATAITTFLFNITMMDLSGEDGVAAITIMVYSQFLLNTGYIGFSMGVAPIIGFNHGNKNDARQKSVLRICIAFIAVTSLLVFAGSVLGGPGIVRLFAADTSEVYRIAADGFRIFSCGFLFCGLNIFTSALFTALSNGKVSAALSFLRTFGFLAGGILLLPRIWGITGVWLAVPAAEGVMFLVSVWCLTRL